jgi:hypothetical protein
MAVLPITAVENLPCVETDFDNLTSLDEKTKHWSAVRPSRSGSQDDSLRC